MPEVLSIKEAKELNRRGGGGTHRSCHQSNEIALRGFAGNLSYTHAAWLAVLPPLHHTKAAITQPHANLLQRRGLGRSDCTHSALAKIRS